MAIEKRDIQAVFFDIDGTLVPTDTSLLPVSTHSALEKLKQKGIKIFICTGRPHKLLLRFLNEIDIQFDGYSMMNGQLCYVEDKKVREVFLPKENLTNAIHYMKQQDIYGLIAHKDGVYRTKVMRQGDIVFDEETSSLDIYEMNAHIDVEHQQEADQLMNLLPDCRALRWNLKTMDIINADSSKAKGMDAIIDYLGIPLENTMAFGDGENDIDMIVHAGIGVAMGNSMEGLKKAADYITSDMNDDGIEKALQHFGIIE